MPGSEPEIAVLSRLGSPPRLPSATVVVCQENSWIEMFGDKLNCMRAFDGKIELAPYADGRDKSAVNALITKVGFPVVVKSRRSSGSKTVCVAHNPQELERFLSKVSLPLVQQYLKAKDGEFSVGIFVCKHFEATIAFKRELGPGGCSWTAETVYHDDVLQYAHKIARVSGLRGSANVQVKKTAEGVRLLEVNPHFSSLVALRALCGFRDLEWSIKMALGLEIEPPKLNYPHILFSKFCS